MHHRNVGKHYKNVNNISHNHCQCLLLYKLAELPTSGLGRFFECRKCAWYMYTRNALGRCKLLRVVCIYQKKQKCLCYNMYLWFLYSLKKSKKVSSQKRTIRGGLRGGVGSCSSLLATSRNTRLHVLIYAKYDKT